MRKTSDCPWCDCSDAARRRCAWKADATTLSSGTVNLPSAAKNYSPVEKAGCYRSASATLAGTASGSGALLVRALLACQDGAAIAS